MTLQAPATQQGQSQDRLRALTIRYRRIKSQRAPSVLGALLLLLVKIGKLIAVMHRSGRLGQVPDNVRYLMGYIDQIGGDADAFLSITLGYQDRDGFNPDTAKAFADVAIALDTLAEHFGVSILDSITDQSTP